MRIKWLSLIRVIGLVFVLLYHFFLSVFPGGFVGVDIFFTLSGFLMTSLLLDEYTKTENVNVIRFFRKRLYRILPCLLLMILIATPLTLLVRNDFRSGIGSQIVASLGFVTNFFEILSGNSYENQFTPHIFLHTWTLALEIHFYFFWIIAVWGMTKVAKTIGQLRGMIFLSSGLLFSTSLLSMVISSFFVENVSDIYFSSWTHIFPFFLGAILASLSGTQFPSRAFYRIAKTWTKKKTVGVFGGALSILLLLLFTLPFNSIWPYVLGIPVASIAAAVLIYAARVFHEKSERLAEPVWINFISDISYGIYLFHWPFYILFKELLGNTTAVLLSIVLSTLLASLSYHILEPYLAGKPSSIFKGQLDLQPYTKWLVSGFALLGFTTLIISWTAPKMGNFEREMLISNLKQADSQLAATRTAAENARATNYNIQEGVTIFGDSVTVRARPAIESALPDADIDGTVSRHLTEITNLVNLYKESNTLKENVVVALGTNTSEEYKELLDELIKAFPKGHRLIFVTPYDGNYGTQDDSVAYQTGQYEKKLAKEHDYITIADWFQMSTNNPHIWEGTDLVHFSLETNGGDIFAQTIRDAITQAEKTPVKQ